MSDDFTTRSPIGCPSAQHYRHVAMRCARGASIDMGARTSRQHPQVCSSLHATSDMTPIYLWASTGNEPELGSPPPGRPELLLSQAALGSVCSCQDSHMLIMVIFRRCPTQLPPPAQRQAAESAHTPPSWPHTGQRTAPGACPFLCHPSCCPPFCRYPLRCRPSLCPSLWSPSL